MPAVCVQGSSLTTGHGCDAVTILAIPPQVKVTISGILAAIVGTPTVPHLIQAGSSCVTHVAFLNTGSAAVTIGGIAVGRVGDSADAGAMISGSPFVSIDI
jgi:uncharacterized Zn-binding protein involved in type VI secretion